MKSGMPDVFLNRSTDAGATWMPIDLRLPAKFPGVTPCGGANVAASGSDVYVVWQDGCNGLPDIYLRASTDSGATFGPEVRLDTDALGAGNSAPPEIVCNGKTVVVAWPDSRNGQFDVRMNRSGDGGLTWLAADVRLDTDLPAGGANSVPVRLAITGTDVYAVWSDNRAGAQDIRMNRSTDGGATWLAADVRLDTDGAGTHGSSAPVVACDVAGVVVAWEDARDGSTDIRANASSDHGATWLASDLRLDTDALGSAPSTAPSLAMRGSTVLAVWQDLRVDAGEIRFRKSVTGGTSWVGSDVRLDNRPAGFGASTTPRIVADSPYAFVTWADTRNGPSNVYLQASTDDGTDWWPTDLRIDGAAAGIGSAVEIRPACVGRDLKIVWQDARNGANDVYFRRSP